MLYRIDHDAMVTDYGTKYATMKIERTAATEAGVKKMYAGRARYEAVSARTPNRIPWYFIAALHYRESSCNFNGCLANGQNWRRVTTIEPKGAGPWRSWEDSAVWALAHEGFFEVQNWTAGEMLFRGEEFNGEGYHLHGWDNPYLFGGTNYYTSGKYIRDRVYDPDAVDPQIGIAALIMRTAEIETGNAAPLALAGFGKNLHPVDRAAVTANSRALRFSGWYQDFCHYLGLTWAAIFATFQQMQPYLTDWRTLTVLGILGGGYLASQIGAFNLSRAAAQGRYVPSGLATVSMSPPGADVAEPVQAEPSPAPAPASTGVPANA